ncbi:MAG: S-layer homology domain-containing protein [Selenomonadaceae bacterium]|nr:S-layer homology domain-containing protein [Selenomonadaceae bacterium]
MKKKIASVLAASLVVGAASTTFAAANPFSDLDPDHWAYQSVMQLYNTYTADGKRVIDGMGDGTFQGKRPITRYEVAQMVAKALARTDINGTDKAALDRLAAEFSEELQSLGVRVAELEKYADKAIWQGKIEYTYKSHRTYDVNGGKKKINQDDWIFRFEPILEVNNHWTLRARIDAHNDFSRNDSSDFNLVRGWAQGDYDNFQVKVGKQPLYTNEDGIVWDTEYSGAEVTVGNKLKATLYAGRLSAGTAGGTQRNAGAWNGRQDGYWSDKRDPELGTTAEERWNSAVGRTGLSGTDPSSFQAINIQYTPDVHGLFGGAGYYHIEDDDFGTDANRNYAYSDDGNEDTANIWSVNAGYKFSPKAKLWGSYANNTKADYEDKSWQALFAYGTLYGGGNQNTKKGQWAVWAGYKKLGSNTSLCAINWDDAFAGTKGVVAGASWAPMDRVVFLAKYFKGDYITGDGDAERLFGRVEFFY